MTHWIGADFYPPTLAPIIVKSVSNLDLEPLRHHANLLRGRDDCMIKPDRFSCGKDHVVFELTFGDATIWVARLPLCIDPTGVICHTSIHMRNEIAALKFVQHHSRILVPEVHGFNLGENNKIGVPYVFMSAFPGSILRPLPRVDIEHKPQVYQQVARLMIDMSQLPRWEKIGHLNELNDGEYCISGLSFANEDFPGVVSAVSSARDYYDTRAKMLLDLMVSSQDLDKIALAWLYHQAVPYFVGTENFPSGFPLCHADFSNCNFLFDAAYNLTGVIDWSGAQSTPWELFCVFPHEFSSRYAPDGNVDVESRNLFISILEQEERKVNLSIPLSNFMRSKAGRIAELVEYYQYLNAASAMPWRDIRELMGLMYGDGVEWEDVKTKAKAALHIS